MKVGIVCYPVYGGSGVVAVRIALHLAQMGHEVHLISYEPPAHLEKLPSGLTIHQVPVMHYPLFEHPPYESALVSRIVTIHRQRGLDLLHVHYAVPHASVGFLVRSLLGREGRSLPYIVTLHGTDVTLVGRDASYLPVVRFGVEEADGVTAVSRYLVEASVRLLGIQRPIRHIPNFVDMEEVERARQLAPLTEQQLRARLNAPSQPIIVHASNFRAVKRPMDVARIFELVVRKLDARLLLIGEGPERSRVEMYLAEKNLLERVLMAGYVENPLPLLYACRVFVLPSEHESFGLAALEALACGVPVVASNTEGLPELIADGECGFLCNVGDVEAFAKRVIELLTNDSLHQRMSTAARQRALLYECGRVIPQYLKLYEEVCELQSLSA